MTCEARAVVGESNVVKRQKCYMERLLYTLRSYREAWSPGRGFVGMLVLA
jgi:hypothetical protein